MPESILSLISLLNEVHSLPHLTEEIASDRILHKIEAKRAEFNCDEFAGT